MSLPNNVRRIGSSKARRSSCNLSRNGTNVKPPGSPSLQCLPGISILPAGSGPLLHQHASPHARFLHRTLRRSLLKPRSTWNRLEPPLSGHPSDTAPHRCSFLAISEFPKWRKYLILLSFLDNSSARPVQIGGVDVNICHSRSTAVRGRRRSSSQSPPRGPFCRTRTGPVEADGAVDAQNAPTAPWKTLCVFHELPQGLSHQVTHEKLRKAPKYRWETRIDPLSSPGGLRCTQAGRQPAGTGSAQILRSMSPNSRRVRCPSASRSQ